MTSDGGHHGAYNPALINVVLSEAAHLLRHLGFTASHTVLIGGVAPSLLVLDPATNLAHVGTTDLDLCLSVAIVEGDTAEYERIENALREGWLRTDRRVFSMAAVFPYASGGGVLLPGGRRPPQRTDVSAEGRR